MHSINHLRDYFKSYGLTNKPLIAFSLFLFFWTLFDGFVSFFTPILITERGFSVFTMGLIYSSSSVFGAIFDLVIGRYFQNTKYKRFIYALLLLCFAYPLLLFKANNAFLFVTAMAVWGIYYDLKIFSKFDFAVSEIKESEHTSSFGLMSVFEGLGYMLAPFIASLLIIYTLTWYPIAFTYFFLVLALIFFLSTVLLVKHKKTPQTINTYKHKKISFITEIKTWIKVSKKIRHLLILSLLLSLLDAFYWTIGPLLIEQFSNHFLGSLFLTCFMIPGLFTGFFIGNLAKKHGDKKVAFGSFILGSLFLALIFPFRSSEVIMVGLVLLSSFFFSLCLPSLSSLFVKFVRIHPEHEVDILGVNDFFINMAYVIGPVLGGFFAQIFGFTTIFSIYSLIGLIMVMLLIISKGHKRFFETNF